MEYLKLPEKWVEFGNLQSLENLCSCIQVCKNMVKGPGLDWDKYEELEKVA